MAISPGSIIWTGKSVGITLEEYQGKYSIKACKRYESQGQEKVGYDWSFPQEWDKDKRSFVPREKAAPSGVYLGSKEEATKALNEFLTRLSAKQTGQDTGSDEEIPW